jgi:hypothetical protein
VKFYVRVNDSAVAARFARIGPGVRQGLIDALTPQADAIAADVRSIWSARSKYMGADPGALVDNIQSGVSTKNPDRVTGYVRSDKPGVFFGGRLVPLAQLLEYGANVPAHQILAVLGKALHFTGSAGETFAKSVQSPGATIPAYPAIHPAFDAHRADIRDAIEGVARKAGEL